MLNGSEVPGGLGGKCFAEGIVLSYHTNTITLWGRIP